MQTNKQTHTHLFEGKPAAGRVGRVGGVSQALQGRGNGITVGLLEPGLVWCLCWSCCDAADVIQGENHGTHQSRVLLTHNGNLFVPAAQQRMSVDWQASVTASNDRILWNIFSGNARGAYKQ